MTKLVFLLSMLVLAIGSDVCADGTCDETEATFSLLQERFHLAKANRKADAPCSAEVWPKSRECAIQLGSGVNAGGYQYSDGTGKWCSNFDGASRLTMTEA